MNRIGADIALGRLPDMGHDVFMHVVSDKSLVHGVVRGTGSDLAAQVLPKSRRASLLMKVDSRYGSYLDIVQKNTDPNIGPTLNATCRVSF